MQKMLLVLTSMVLATMLLLSACGAPATPPPLTATGTAIPSETAIATITPTEMPTLTPTITLTPTATLPPLSNEPVEIRWFVGLGTGSDANQISVEKQVVKDFNAEHPNIILVLDIVPYASAQQTLKGNIAAGKGPDVVGPMGWSSMNQANTNWLNLDALIQDSNYDMSDFNPNVVKSFQTEDGQMSIPFMIFPGTVYYQKELFDKAGLTYPPASYGEKYKMPDGSEVEWSWDTLTQVARLLTLDTDGKNATQEGFDPQTIVQYGYTPQWQSPAYMGAYRGAERLYDADKNAVIPDQYKAAWQWYFDGMWGKQRFIPNQRALNSYNLGNGNGFNGRHVAMAISQSWYTCCLVEAGSHWDMAALPSYNGQVYGRVDTDTFRILKQTAHPREAFEVLKYLTGPAAKKLLDVYTGMPARISLQEDYFTTLGKKFPFVKNWTILQASSDYIDIPNSDDYAKDVLDRFSKFDESLTQNGQLDINDTIEKLRTDLEKLFKK